MKPELVVMKPKSIPAEDTLRTLGPEAHTVATTLMEGGEKYLMQDEEVAAIVAAPNFGLPKVFPLRHTNHPEKKITWSFLRLLRATHPVVGMINECWYSENDIGWDPEVDPMPSEDPNHKEMMMINLWDCERSVVFAADIFRNPSRLGEWRTLQDSDFPLDTDSGFTGAIMEGEPFRRSLN